jgi:hypothetical protein
MLRPGCWTTMSLMVSLVNCTPLFTKVNIMLENPLKAAILGYIAAMAIVSTADAQTAHSNSVTVNVPVQCYPGLDIIKGYKAEGIFEPLMISSGDVLNHVLYVDPDDGELHHWIIADDVPCLLSKTMLKGINTDVLTSKGKL